MRWSAKKGKIVQEGKRRERYGKDELPKSGGEGREGELKGIVTTADTIVEIARGQSKGCTGKKGREGEVGQKETRQCRGRRVQVRTRGNSRRG